MKLDVRRPRSKGVDKVALCELSRSEIIKTAILRKRLTLQTADSQTRNGGAQDALAILVAIVSLAPSGIVSPGH
jgi:hypothetical protein